MRDHTAQHSFLSARPLQLLPILFVAALFVLGQAAWSDTRDHKRGKRQVNITEVFVTLEDAAYDGVDTITIVGEDFRFGEPPLVMLGNFPEPLVVLEASDTQVVVECPTTIGGSIVCYHPHVTLAPGEHRELVMDI